MGRLKVMVLFSGGKDSTFAFWRSIQQGLDVMGLLTMIPSNPESWMFHYPCIELTELQATASQTPIFQVRTEGKKEKELTDLKSALRGFRDTLGIEAVVSGAIASEYQKGRIAKICNELNIKSLTPLWHWDPEKLLKEMLNNNFEIVFTAVSAAGFTKEWLGRKLDEEAIKDMKVLQKKYGINLSLEGGEGETFVLNCPIFKRKIKFGKVEKMWNIDSGYLLVKDVKIIPKKD
ncbi:MAG: diphthine--ammonia ligase, partial [Candidatus Bathyarchaeota archaeon]